MDMHILKLPPPPAFFQKMRDLGFKPFVFVLAVILMIGFGSWSCSSRDSGTAQELTFGSTNNEADALIYIAYEQGFFTATGLNVTIKDYTSGTAAINGLLNGEVEMATASEYAIVQNALKQQAISTIGSISKNYSTHLVTRTDRGIRSVADLEGKRVGVPVGTLAQFYLGRFLDLNGMHGKPMTLVNTDVAQSVDALVNGDVDAVQTWEPYVSRIKEKLGDKVIVWPTHNEQPQYKNVTVTNDWLAKHPDIAQRVLKSLAEAERFVALHPDQTKTIVQKRLQYNDEYMAIAWPLTEFALSLDQSLILAMDDEARWMIGNNLTTERQVPDFRNYIYIDGLKAVNAEAVNIR